MGDLSTEPSMEDILSSIKRIIAEEGDQPVRRARPIRHAPPPSPAVPMPRLDDAAEEEVLELSQPLPTARAEPPAWPDVADVQPSPAPPVQPQAAPPPLARAADPILSTDAVAASRGALDSLSRMLVKPEPGSDGTLEALVREMLRPMLRDWLDANLPAMVETLVSREIARIARP